MLVHMLSRQTSLRFDFCPKKKRENEDIGKTDKLPMQLMHLPV